ncbi:hypothetical protein ACQ4LE_005441 [Meloidogyne hapla]|uniref:Uncharacterized protein n=1 Tax=Meloidogyne hapla TaxID=6305 RepID=A0A1I8BCP1_MELHA
MSRIFSIYYQILKQLFILILFADLLHAAVLHPHLRRTRNHDIKSIHLDNKDEQKLNWQIIQLSHGNDDSSLIDRLISSLSTSGENIELIIQNPIHNQQQIQQEEIKKRKRNDCFFSLVNCRLAQTSLITSRLRQRLQSVVENMDESRNSKQRIENKRRTRKLITTKL